MSQMTTRERVMSELRDMVEHQMIRSNNNDCRELVNAKIPFNGSNLFAKWIFPEPAAEAPLYVVFSYGTHYPMYIYEPIEGTWFENVTGWSKTTGKHESQARPTYATLPLDLDTMKEIVIHGIETIFQNYTGETYEPS